MNFFVFDWELVVVRYFFPEGDGLFGIDDNLFFTVDGNDLGVTVGLRKGITFVIVKQSVCLLSNKTVDPLHSFNRMMLVCHKI
jgi:hypothetical protein